MTRQPLPAATMLWAVCLLFACISLRALCQVESGSEEAPSPSESDPRESAADLRGLMLLDYDCRSEIHQRRISLFANGTVRMRTEGIEESRVRLAELSPEELRGFLNRLKAENLEETDEETWSPRGEWIERCDLVLTLQDRPSERFRLDRFGTVSLALSRVLSVVKALDLLVDERSPPTRHLPAEYRPQSGDILERMDGKRFQVVRYTMENLSVELTALDMPLTVFIRLDEIRKHFAALISRRER